MRVVIIIAAAVLAHSTAIVGSETLTCSGSGRASAARAPARTAT